MSRPVWARGLKLGVITKMLQVGMVAPRVGAWIETGVTTTVFDGYKVAPRVGAWIETQTVVLCVSTVTSRPVWARGLKRSYCCP